MLTSWSHELHFSYLTYAKRVGQSFKPPSQKHADPRPLSMDSDPDRWYFMLMGSLYSVVCTQPNWYWEGIILGQIYYIEFVICSFILITFILYKYRYVF